MYKITGQPINSICNHHYEITRHDESFSMQEFYKGHQTPEQVTVADLEFAVLV